MVDFMHWRGLHTFETFTERLLWRISSCAVMAGLPLSFSLLWILVNLPDDLSQTLSTLVTFIFGILQILQIPILITYVLARAYLVVECFINLSHLPAGVYDVPSWSIYFPHIS